MSPPAARTRPRRRLRARSASRPHRSDLDYSDEASGETRRPVAAGRDTCAIAPPARERNFGGIDVCYTRPLRLARGKEPGDRRPVGWTRSDVKKPDGARRIDKDIAAELTHIAVEVGGSGQSSSEQLLRVRPPRAWTPDVPPLAAEHAVPLVKRPRLVDENGPPNTRSGCVRAGLRPALERHYDDADVEFLKHRFVLLQLQQMPTARQSAQMPMEDQQEPVPAVIVEVVEPTFRIRQRKRHRRITDMYAHEDSPLYSRSPPVQRPISRAASGAKRSPSVRGSKLPSLRVPGGY